jgi:hypothetical protein
MQLVCRKGELGVKALQLLCMLCLFSSHSGLAQSSKPAAEAETTVLRIYKDQLAALDVAIREMRRMGRSFRGQQVRIEDHGKSVSVGFMNDPLDERIVGDQNGITFEIRKSDLKVITWSLAR